MRYLLGVSKTPEGNQTMVTIERILTILAMALAIALMAPSPASSGSEGEPRQFFNPSARVDPTGQDHRWFRPESGEYTPWHQEGHPFGTCWVERHYGEYVWCENGDEYWPNGEPGEGYNGTL